MADNPTKCVAINTAPCWWQVTAATRGFLLISKFIITVQRRQSGPGHEPQWPHLTMIDGHTAHWEWGYEAVIKTRAQDSCALCEFFLNLEIWSNLDLFGNWILLQHSLFLFLALLDTLLCLRFINSSFILPTKPKCSCLQILKCINVNVVVKWHIFHRNCTNALKMFPHIFPQCSVTECHCTSAGDRQVPQSSPQLRQSVWRLEHEYSPRQTSYWTVTLCYCDIYADIYHLLYSSQSVYRISWEK